MKDFAVGDVVRLNLPDAFDMTVIRPATEGKTSVTWNAGEGEDEVVHYDAFSPECLVLVRRSARPLVIPTGEPRWISEEEDAASPPSPRLRDATRGAK